MCTLKGTGVSNFQFMLVSPGCMEHKVKTVLHLLSTLDWFQAPRSLPFLRNPGKEASKQKVPTSIDTRENCLSSLQIGAWKNTGSFSEGEKSVHGPSVIQSSSAGDRDWVYFLLIFFLLSFYFILFCFIYLFFLVYELGNNCCWVILK